MVVQSRELEGKRVLTGKVILSIFPSDCFSLCSLHCNGRNCSQAATKFSGPRLWSKTQPQRVSDALRLVLRGHSRAPFRLRLCRAVLSAVELLFFGHEATVVQTRLLCGMDSWCLSFRLLRCFDLRPCRRAPKSKLRTGHCGDTIRVRIPS